MVWRRGRRKSAAISWLPYRHFNPEMQVKIPSVRIVIFGSGGVGKTSLVQRYLYNSFEDRYQPTIEDDHRKVIPYKGNLCDVTVLDTTGTHQFPAMRELAIKNGDGFIVVYAIDDKMSLLEAKRLRDEIVKVKGNKEVPLVLLGNKSDRSPVGRRKVGLDAGQMVVDEWNDGSVHMETSAKLNHNVVNAFNKVLELIDLQPAFEEVDGDSSPCQRRPSRKDSIRRGVTGAWRTATHCFHRSRKYKADKQEQKFLA
eukprot:gene10776-19569_t